jgi:hypothetical protein
MSRSTTAVFPGLSGHNDDPYEDEEDDELTAAQKAEHARIRASINARLAALQAEAKSSRSISANVGPRQTKKQKQAAALAKRQATLAAKAAAAAADEEEDEGEDEEAAEDVKPVGGAGSGPAAAVPMTSANYVAAAAARYAASGLPVAKNRSVRFFDMANTRRTGLPNARVLIRNRNTRKSTTRKPVVPMVNMGRSRNAANISALFAKMTSWAVTNDPGYLTKVLLHIKKDPRYLDAHLTDKEKELLKAPGVLAKLERQAAMMNKE